MAMHQIQSGQLVSRISTDKRSAKRIRSSFSAAIFVEDKFYDYCIIEDVSETGLRLKMQKQYQLPETFHVRIPSMAENVLVRIAWLKGFECGVEFVASDPEPIEEPAA